MQLELAPSPWRMGHFALKVMFRKWARARELFVLNLALCGFPGILDSENMLESCLMECVYEGVRVEVTQVKQRLP